jgi:hypothetical protein
MGAWLADFCTLGRLGLALFLVIIGMEAREPAQAVRRIALGLLVGWTADILDGALARRSSCPTRLSRWDFPLDMAMVAGSVVGLTMAGLLPLGLTVGYFALGSLVLLRYPSKATAMAIACPAVFAPFVLASRWAPDAFHWAVFWAVAMLVWQWRRFEEVVLEFVDTFPGGTLKPLGTIWRRWRSLRQPTSAT